MDKLRAFFSRLLGAAAGVAALVFPTFASVVNENPVTGDLMGRNIGLVGIILGVSLVVIIIIAIISARGKRKK